MLEGRDVTANVSLLFGERPYLERFAAARDAGFNTVETWWPFAAPVPGEKDLAALLSAIERAGVRLTGLNTYAGDMPGGERGLACLPDRRAELEANLPVVLRIADATGCRRFNVLYGQPLPGDDHLATALDAYRTVSSALASIAGMALVEPLAEGLNGSYPILSQTDAVSFLDQLGVANASLLFDTFHLTQNGVDVVSAFGEVASRVGHVQVADSPGRGEPGSGTIDWDAFTVALDIAAYEGAVAAEYKPTRRTEETLGWLR